MRITVVGAVVGAVALLAGPGHTVPYPSSDVPKAIDPGAAVSRVVVPAGAGRVGDVDIVNLAITHGDSFELQATLTSPSGTTVVLWNNICGGAWSANAPFNIDDAAAKSMGDDCPPVAGRSYKPEDALSAFNGEPASGTWTLLVDDVVDNNGARGSLQGWTLDVDRMTYMVNSANDLDDGVCNATHCSLREAIKAANAEAGLDRIHFSIGSGAKTIAPVSPLPAVTGPVEIDGSTQPGWAQRQVPIIFLDGMNAGQGADGLRLTGGGSKVRDLGVNSFKGDGIELTGPGGNEIFFNWIGIAPSGSDPAGNGGAGVAVVTSSANIVRANWVTSNAVGVRVTGSAASGNAVNSNTIGDPDGFVGGNLGDAIVVDGAPGTIVRLNGVLLNSGHGVHIRGAGATGSIVQGNYLLTGGGDGIFIDGAPSSTIGVASSSGNVIADNGGHGIRIAGSGATGNVVGGNWIGTNVFSEAHPNAGSGVRIENGAYENVVGGTTPDERNFISANAQHGVHISDASFNEIRGNHIGVDIAGTSQLPNNGDGVFIENGSGNVVGGGQSERNIISGNDGNGVRLVSTQAGTGGNKIRGNYIGVDASGLVPIGNQLWGIYIDEPGNIVEWRNVIAGNGRAGSYGGIFTARSDNVIAGNYIGHGADGASFLPNTDIGVDVAGGPNNVVGGDQPGERNLIANHFLGVRITGSGNVVRGNYIGTDWSGSVPYPNNQGIVVDSGSSNTIGPDNVISGNKFDGVRLAGIFGSTTGNRVVGNYIGTWASGDLALPNGIGVEISGVGSNVVEDNVISGNTSHGVWLHDFAFANRLEGNRIGVNVLDSPRPNGGQGVYIVAAGGNTIGGTKPGDGNTIYFNSGNGVAVVYTGTYSATSNGIRRNGIGGNGGLGIDLGLDSVTPNDAGDGDTGANDLQNFPVLTGAVSTASSTGIAGTLDSRPNMTYTLEFFSANTCDASGHGEGAEYLGSRSVKTNANGQASFQASVARAVPVGSDVTATTTEPTGGTSEFSACRRVAAPSSLSIADATVVEGASGTTRTATFNVSLSPASGVTVTVRYATANGTAVAPGDYAAKGGKVTFKPGQTSKTVKVTINGDNAVEPDETFFVDLSQPSLATIHDGRGVGTIRNDD